MKQQKMTVASCNQISLQSKKRCHKMIKLTLIITVTAAICVSCQGDAGADNCDGPLWSNSNQVNWSSNDEKISSKLDELLNRTGPNMRASADYRDFQDVNLAESLEAWRLLHTQAERYAQGQVRFYEPKLRLILRESNVSSTCLSASIATLGAIRRLDSWAVKMWSFSGNFPPGSFLDGQLTDLGSYRGCVDILSLDEEKHEQQQQQSRHPASYCIFGFRPIVPKRKRFHLIFEEESPSLIKLFNSNDYFASMAKKAQYFHYLYLKTGLCVPSECSARDMQQVSRTIGRKLALMSAPVKCFTRASPNETQRAAAPHQNNATTTTLDENLADNEDMENLENKRPVMIRLNELNINKKQLISLALLGGFMALVASVTIWHALELIGQKMRTTHSEWSPDDFDDGQQIKDATNINLNNTTNNYATESVNNKTMNNLKSISCVSSSYQDYTLKGTTFYYFSMITNGHEFLDTSMRPLEIRCLHGFRVFTMIWIICVHTLQYNEWSGFTRVYENVPSLQNPFVHPLINANYCVDTFFLISGLLASYTIWHSNKGGSTNFSIGQSLFARYLRLTPQVLLVSLLYIVLPLTGQNGPFWYDMTHYVSKYCEKNWWVNLLHLQAFYRYDEMCNLVSWWISVDMLFYAIALVFLYLILNKHVKFALASTCAYVLYCTLVTGYRHYVGGFTPNNLGLVPQVQEVWTEFVVYFFWSPYPHAFVFFFGLWIGYMLANKIALHQVRRWSSFGWSLSISTLIIINLSSRLWTVGTLELTPDKQYISTSYNLVCVMGWTSSFAWMIVACQYGCAPNLNKLMSTKLCIMLSKASFIIYLSHMLILRIFYGSQYNLLEVSIGTITLLLIGMSTLSILFGIFLYIAFETPCLKFSKFILSKIKTERKLPLAGSSYHVVEMNSNIITSTTNGPNEQKDGTNSSPLSITLLK